MTARGLPPALAGAVERWLADDPDLDDRAELAAVLARGDEAELADRFSQRLEFGTAGLRGAMAAGPNRMNVAVVRAAAAGIADHLNHSTTGAGPSVVLGYDARLRSHRFAEEAARVLAAAGVRAKVLPRPLPTPVLAFAVRHLRASAGLMVTASHNPPGDNGLKVYGPDGAQIVPPTDAAIAAAIERVGPLAAVPVARAEDPFVERLGDEIEAAYVGAVAGAVPVRGLPPAWVHTALHGVGSATLLRVLDAAGVSPPTVVAEQADPDPAFPTVAFPNPEEPGALDLALATAASSGTRLVLANDPDADRLAVAVATGGQRAGDAFHRLTGDELGALLAEHLLSRPAPAGDHRRPLVVTTVVSSRLLRAIAAAHGADYAETLTGFKWLVRPALAAAHERRLVLAYEEALGYCVGEVVRDKDGLGAALAVLDMAAGLDAEGRTLGDALDDLARRYGVHATAQVSVRDDAPGGLERLRAAVAELRSAPPAAVGDQPVERFRDLLVDHEPPPGSVGEPWAPTDALVLELAGAARVVARPSGTEPKLKAYLEVVEPVGASDVGTARTAAAARLGALAAAIRAMLAR